MWLYFLAESSRDAFYSRFRFVYIYIRSAREILEDWHWKLTYKMIDITSHILYKCSINISYNFDYVYII